MKVLVCIASYGTKNDAYLSALLREYAGMSFEMTLVVLSNIEKSLPAGVALRVGLPTNNPWSLPFAHREVFLERQHAHDLFIYSEDDTLITQAHIEAFLEAAKVLREEEIAGFIRSEEGSDGTLYYSTIHQHHHWDPRSVIVRGGYTFAHLTNEHGACYMLTRNQLRRAIASGGFAVAPHEDNKYDMLVSAATDPYTQCGFRKLLCVSRLDRFTCQHLTNKYVGRTGVEKKVVDIQVEALESIARGDLRAAEPMHVETKVPRSRWSKSYYEPRDEVLLSLIPQDARRVLSIGCGWGQTEEELVRRGVYVVAVPLDVVIGVVASRRGVEVVEASAHQALEDAEPFDAILLSSLLHLLPDPVTTLERYGRLLSQRGVVVVSYPNLAHLAVQFKRLISHPDVDGVGDFARSGMHLTSPATVKRWLRTAGFAMRHAEARFVGRWRKYNGVTLGLLRGMWANEFAVLAAKDRVGGRAA
jgi:2-polyprenyl-3-methyl-5-hydroxy-6-metoxy-1,4-benzoquinol methylase